MLKTRKRYKKDILTIANIIGIVGVEKYENNWIELHKLNGLNSKHKFEYRGILLENNRIASCHFKYMNKNCYIYWDYKIDKYMIIFR